MNIPARGSLLGIEHLDTKEILGLLKLARRMNPQKARPLLRGKRVVLLFYEASTRTRTSFEFAAKSLGAMTTLVQSSGSSIKKASRCWIRDIPCGLWVRTALLCGTRRRERRI